jgi:hypothetical protein
MGNRQGKDQEKDELEFYDDSDEESSELSDKQLETHLTRLISYANSASPSLQREVAEKLANEAVNPTRQSQIVKLGGLDLLLPLTLSTDLEVRRLAAHALANLSVDRGNQEVIGDSEEWVTMIISLLTPMVAQSYNSSEDGKKESKSGGERMSSSSTSTADSALAAAQSSAQEAVQRQASKALANLGVNATNKTLISKLGALPPLITLSRHPNASVSVEAVAALANLAVNDSNEEKICELGGIEPILGGVKSGNLDLQSQCARALRNLSVNPKNKKTIINLGGIEILKGLRDECSVGGVRGGGGGTGRSSGNKDAVERVRMQAIRGLVNLGITGEL